MAMGNASIPIAAYQVADDLLKAAERWRLDGEPGEIGPIATGFITAGVQGLMGACRKKKACAWQQIARALVEVIDGEEIDRLTDAIKAEAQSRGKAQE